MIVNQNVSIDGNDVSVTNTFDIGTAKDLVKEANQDSDMHRGNSMRLMGHIPPEMFLYDFNLMRAKKCRAEGDGDGYAKALAAFYKEHPYLKVNYAKKVWSMGGIT